MKGIHELTRKIDDSEKDKLYLLIYLLVTLVLILPIATTIVEMTFSAMLLWIENQIGWEKLIAYIENDIFSDLDDEIILQYFQHMKIRREQL